MRGGFDGRQGRTIRQAVVLVIALSLVALVASPAAADPNANELTMKRQINHERVERGLPRLRLNEDLIPMARRHSREMAREGRVSHTDDLESQLPGSWRYVGENVGTGPSVKRIHEVFMSSSSHRAVILDSHYRQVGIGIIERAGALWVTLIFVG